MKNLLNFIIRYSVFFLFIILEVIALILVSQNKGYQRSVMLSSSNQLVGNLYEKSNSVVEFFKLKAANDVLADENSQLKNRVAELENKLSSLTDSTNSNQWKSIVISPEKDYRFISAKVIRNTTNLPNNYITINKGSNDGITSDMGVIAAKGVVGIVKTVSPKFAVVIPILNQKSSISTKFKRNDYYGPVVWNGEDYRYGNFQDIPRHVKFSLGDTLITSGLAKNFPDGILVGTVNNYNIKSSDPYYNIQVKLAVDFRTLTHVDVIDYKNYKEQKALEDSVAVKIKK